MGELFVEKGKSKSRCSAPTVRRQMLVAKSILAEHRVKFGICASLRAGPAFTGRQKPVIR